MPNTVYIATSIDGFIARKDGNIDWLMEVSNPENDDYGFGAFMGSMDAVIMGRNTFETVVSFGEWPYAKPVFVLSSSIKHIPKGYEGKAEILSGELKTLVTSLNEKGFNNLYIDGGKTIQSFLQLDLIDELIITRIPIILGSGIPLFVESEVELKLEHVNTEVLSNALVKSHYKRKSETR